MVAQLIDDDDVGMLQHSRGFGFTVETLQQIRIFGEGAGHHFDGNQALNQVVHGLVDDAHATFADDLYNVVFPNFCQCVLRHLPLGP